MEDICTSASRKEERRNGTYGKLTRELIANLNCIEPAEFVYPVLHARIYDGINYAV